MDVKRALSFVVGILILGTLGLSQDAFADPLTLFPTFVDSFSVTAQETNPTGVAFSSDGTKMFVVGNVVSDAVNEYTLSTAFDVSTADFVDSFSVATQGPNPQGLAFSSDGTKMFVVDWSVDAVNEYTLSTPFDVSTADFVGSFSVTDEETSPTGVAFSSDGTKMFVVGDVGDDVDEYTLSTAFDVSTASFEDSFSVEEQGILPQDLAFSSDGTKMFVADIIPLFIISLGQVNEYTLSTPFDVSTASFVDSFSVTDQEMDPTGVAFSSDGAKMFVVGANGDDVNEYIITSCSPPSSGDWVVDTTCTLSLSPSNPTINNGDLIVQNNSILTIPAGVSLNIDFTNHNLTVKSGSGVLIQAGGAIT